MGKYTEYAAYKRTAGRRPAHWTRPAQPTQQYISKIPPASRTRRRGFLHGLPTLMRFPKSLFNISSTFFDTQRLLEPVSYLIVRYRGKLSE